MQKLEDAVKFNTVLTGKLYKKLKQEAAKVTDGNASALIRQILTERYQK
jgi:uncharacterized FlaG/YvyC family protein